MEVMKQYICFTIYAKSLRIYLENLKTCREYDLNESKSPTNGSIKEQRKKIFRIILDDILKHIKVRFLDFKDLKFISLFDYNEFK